MKEAAARYPLTEGAFRHLIFEAEAYFRYRKEDLRSNGFAECVVRLPGKRRLFIDSEKFEQWMTADSKHLSVKRSTLIKI